MKNIMKTVYCKINWLFFCMIFSIKLFSQVPLLGILDDRPVFRPLDTVSVICAREGTISVIDGNGREYQKLPANGIVSFIAGGAAGKQSVLLLSSDGKILSKSSFALQPSTEISDGAKMTDLFKLLKKGIFEKEGRGFGEIKHGDRVYRSFEFWDLDNNNIMNGMQYFMPYGNELTDLLRKIQREDGMIWSFIEAYPGHEGLAAYYETAYMPINFYRKKDDIFLVRQPVDNHSDFNFVLMLYKHWKASGNDDWMKANLPAAIKALNYCYTDSIRWSKKYQLLKRPYCIDSWDFQVNDAYTAPAPVSPTMVVVPGKTKYGIFFGDNTGYFEACNQLANMLAYSGKKHQAAIFSLRGQAVLKNLMALSWNGKYFTHFIEEDSSVKRELGVDEKKQLAQSNMYSLNRGLPHEVNKAIIETYLQLRDNLPAGSPGEWYSIYPPFEKGFDIHNAKWQYMNGGVAGHAIGELAKGAFENGYEKYGADIITRMYELMKKYQDKIWFAYTGSMPAPPAPPVFKPIDIAPFANMNLWDVGNEKYFSWMNGDRKGNDMRGLPVGRQVFNSASFNVIDPQKNDHRAAVAISAADEFPSKIAIPVNDTAGAVYLLHTISDRNPKNIAGTVSFVYSDGTRYSMYLYKGKDITNWWFAELENERSHIAWFGPNPVSARVGVSQTVIDNPHPEKMITALEFAPSLEGGIYALLAVSLADKKLYIPPAAPSFGGPDYWAAANGMAALVEGLAGVRNEGIAFDSVKLSPRWVATGTDSVKVTIRFAASDGYIAYRYWHDKLKKIINVSLTGSGNLVMAHILLPQDVQGVNSIEADGKQLSFTITKIENSQYADFKIKVASVKKINIRYR